MCMKTGICVMNRAFATCINEFVFWCKKKKKTLPLSPCDNHSGVDHEYDIENGPSMAQ